MRNEIHLQTRTPDTFEQRHVEAVLNKLKRTIWYSLPCPISFQLRFFRFPP